MKGACLMPNWCSTFITLDSNGTPQGNAALRDFYNRLLEADKMYGQKRTFWEQDLAEFCNVRLGVEQRGYITYYSEVSDYNTMHIECEDAWAPNIAFWYYLLAYLYGEGTILINFQASEPGYCIYYYSDPGLGPRYSFDIFRERTDPSSLRDLDRLWDLSDPMLPVLMTNQNVTVYQGFYPGGKMFYPGCVEVFDHYEGDEDDIIEFVDENYKTMPDDATLDTVKEIEGVAINEFKHVDVKEFVDDEMAEHDELNKLRRDKPQPLYTKIKDPCEVINNGNS